MTCDPQSLMDAARCLNCIPMGMMASVATKLLCDLANSEEGPAEVPFSYTPETNLIDWTDATGPHTGDLANFRATADIPTVISLQFPSLLIPSPFNITAIEGLATLPALNTLFLAGNLVETLDCSGCANLTNINANGNQLGAAGGNINVTGCTALQQLTCDFNANLTTIVGLPDCPNLGTLTCTNCAITALDVHACAALVILQADNNNLTGILNCNGLANLGLLTCPANPLLTSLTVNGCGALLTLDASACDLTGTLDLHGLLNLTNLSCGNNFNLTAININGCASLAIISCLACNLNALVTNTCVALTNLDCSSNQITTLDFSGNNALVTMVATNNQLNDGSGGILLTGCINLIQLDVSTNQLSTLDCTGLSSLTSVGFNAGNNTGPLTSINFTNCTSLTSLDFTVGFGSLQTLNFSGATAMISILASNNALTSLDIGTSVNWVTVDAFSNNLTTVVVDDILSKLRTNCLGNNGTATLDGGTNGAPTLSCINPLSDCFALIGAGWTVTTN